MLYRLPGAGLVVQYGFMVRPLRDCEASLRPDDDVDQPLVDEVVVAVQCHLIGRDDLAVSVLPFGPPPAGWNRPFGRPLEASLRRSARQHWMRWARERDSDWGLVLRRLRALRLREPSLKAELAPYLQAMEATLAGPGRPPREGDELLERVIRLPSQVSVPGIGLGNLGGPPWGHDPHDACRPFREGGFKAIAALVRGLDDRRLTRRRPYSWPDEYPLLRVDEACSEFLGDIIGRDTVASWGVWPGKGGGVLPRQKVLAWWAKARTLSEEDYYAQSALTLYRSHNSEHHLSFIARKYPKALPALYRKLLRDHPTRDGADVLECLLSSRLPGRTKRQAVMLGATKGSPVQRHAALAELRGSNPTAFLRLLTREMETMPRRWKDANGRHEFASLVDHLDDQGLWDAYLKAVKRAGPELRMRLLDRFRPEGGVWAERRLSLYAPYLNDYTVMPKDAPDNPSRGQMDLMCGDLLAYHLRDALKVPPPVRFGKSPDFDPSREKWDAFRARAIDALQSRLAEMERNK